MRNVMAVIEKELALTLYDIKDFILIMKVFYFHVKFPKSYDLFNGYAIRFTAKCYFIHLMFPIMIQIINKFPFNSLRGNHIIFCGQRQINMVQYSLKMMKKKQDRIRKNNCPMV